MPSAVSWSIAWLARRSVNWIGCRRPLTSHCHEFLAILRPVMECFGIEIRTVGPLQRSEGWVELNRVEHLQILKRPEYLAFQDWAKIDSLLTPVRKPKRQRIRPDDLEVLDAMDGVIHAIGSLHRNGSILSGGRPDCKSSQSRSSSA